MAAAGGRLPLLLTRLVGRDDLLGLVDERLRRSRLVTLTGPGGAGKTRLAVEAAGRTPLRHDGRVWMAELAEVGDERLLAQAVATAVAPDDVGDDPAEAIRGAGAGPALLVLDNCEQVRTACAQVVTELLAEFPELMVLATSRVPLKVPGEAVVPVHALQWPPVEVVEPAEVARFPAVELFVDRATLHEPAFALDAHNAAEVAAICRLLDGLPLAVELAAAQVRTLAPQEIYQRLRGDPLGLGTAESARGNTLGQVLRWSYDLLDVQAQELLAALSVFSGGFTLEAVEHVCASQTMPRDAVYRAMSHLVDHSLVQATSRHGRTRYSLFEVVRAFASARAAERGGSSVVASPAPDDVVLFIREGDVWSVGRRGRAARLKHSKGLSYLHRLVQAPGQKVHALDLARGLAVAAAPVAVSEMEDAGMSRDIGRGAPVVDNRALTAYRQRYRDLQEELEEARGHRDVGREGRVREEMQFLADELGRVTGLGGRLRTETTAGEKARVAVTKAIRSAIARVADVQPEIGRHLEGAVVTGAFCVYEPRGEALQWETEL